MKLWERVINKLVVVCATGRIPKKGKLFRVSPFSPDTLTIHNFPDNRCDFYSYRRFHIDPNDCATFLVLKVQEDTPLWDQWVQVLYCKQNISSTEEVLIGWITYLEFNRMVLVEWDRWEEEKNLSDN